MNYIYRRKYCWTASVIDQKRGIWGFPKMMWSKNCLSNLKLCKIAEISCLWQSSSDYNTVNNFGRVGYPNIFLFDIMQLFSFHLLLSCYFPWSLCCCCCCCTQCSEHVSPTAAITLKQRYLSQFSLLTRQQLWIDGTRLVAWSSLTPDKESCFK